MNSKQLKAIRDRVSEAHERDIPELFVELEILRDTLADLNEQREYDCPFCDAAAGVFHKRGCQWGDALD